jgi:hypothetical protein
MILATFAKSPSRLARVLSSALLASAAIGAAACPLAASASDVQQTGWLAWFNAAKVSESVGLVSDVQLRSRDEWAGPRNLLVRPGLAWTYAPGHALSAGYAYIGTYNADAADATEHRSWQQYLSTYRLGRAAVTQRLRLEQRFIGRPGAPDVYSDRFRWFSRVQLPITGLQPFTQGAFVALQNEAMVNVSNREELNGHFFDQNRAYVAFGWRYGPRTDIEIGYLNQWLNGRDRDTVNHVLQVAVYTFFR